LQESKNKIPNNEHVIVTAPDRFYQDAIVILLVDWSADLVNQAINALQGSDARLAIHIFDYNDNNYSWLLDVANQADIIAIDLGKINHIDLIKGTLISKSKTFYFGRLDVNRLFSNFTQDPIGELLIKLGNRISQMEEK
jgi:hypothetical protein